jgi:hypothetical protein
MGLQRGAVVGALVAEQLAVWLDPRRVRDQPVPVVVADFMAEMPEQRAVGFAQRNPRRFALAVVGLLDVDRDHPPCVSGHHAWSLRR